MMTRDEFITYLYHIETAAYKQAYKDKILDHDLAQRAEIEKLQANNKTLRETCALRHQEIERLTMQVGTLRKALQLLIAQWEQGGLLTKLMEQAQKALKEVS